MQRFPLRSVESQPQVWLLDPECQSKEEESTYYQAVKITGDSVQGEREESARNTGTLLKDQFTKSCLQSLTLVSGRGRAGQTRVCEERLRCGSRKS